MRAAQERGQECLPPKKRELPPAPVAEQPSSHPSTEKAPAAPPASASSLAAAEWVQAVSPFVPEAVAGLALEQYGLLYKVAVPPPPPPPAGVAFGVASQLIQAPGIPYSPLHFAQLPPAPVHFVGPPYSTVPYALPPGFVPGHLLPPSSSSSSAASAAAAISHFVPYAPLLAEDSSSAAALAAQVFGKQPLDASQGRIPVYYQVSHLPAGYPVFDAPVAALNPEPALLQNHLNPKTATENGVQRTAAGTKEGEAEEHWPQAAVRCSSNGPIFMRAEASSGASQRSSPDTDLEVQRVVGVLSFQDFPQEKGGSSPLNLSHRGHSPEPKGKPAGNLMGTATGADPNPEQEQLLKGSVVANGKPVLGPLQPVTHVSLGASSPEATEQEATCASRPQSHLPSHFMKGAVIQLATGELKRVEDLQTQDFVRSAEVSGGLKIDSSTVVDIQESPWQGLVTLHFVVGEQQSKVSIDVPPEHPFFVYGQGWSSCSPERTTRLFSLPCHSLQVGDVCISISLQSLNGRLAPPASPPADGRERLGRNRQGVQESLVSVQEKSSLGKGGVVLGSPPDASWLSPISAHSWAGPSFQRLGEESPGPPILRPSFIPQEVKLSIEGRSNAGK